MAAAPPTISTHVLDTELGEPARGVRVELYRTDEGREASIGAGTTDEDGRIPTLVDQPLYPGDYRLVFDLASRPRRAESEPAFFRKVSLTFTIRDPARSYHIPLLLAPFGMTTYRGS